MEVPQNRVHHELVNWKKNEEANKLHFPDHVMNSPEFAKFRLQKLNDIVARIKFNSNEEEAYSLKLVQIWQKSLFNKSYPKASKINQVLYFFLNGIKNKLSERRLKQRDHIQKSIIADKLREMGFSESIDRVMVKINSGEGNFSLFANPDSGPRESTSFKLKFQYTEQKGHHFEGYYVAYKNKDQGIPERQLFFGSGDQSIHADIASNLITGRSILKTIQNSRNGEQMWTRYNFSEMDEATGTFKLMTLPHKNFSILHECEKLPIWDKIPAGKQLDIISGLSNGNRVDIFIQQEGKPSTYRLETDPFAGEVVTYDLKGARIDLNKRQNITEQPKNAVSKQLRTNLKIPGNGNFVKRVRRNRKKRL